MRTGHGCLPTPLCCLPQGRLLAQPAGCQATLGQPAVHPILAALPAAGICPAPAPALLMQLRSAPAHAWTWTYGAVLGFRARLHRFFEFGVKGFWAPVLNPFRPDQGTGCMVSGRVPKPSSARILFLYQLWL